MALSTETAAWLEDLRKEGALDDVAFNALKATFESNEKAGNFVKGSVLRQADYSRQSADIQKAKQDVEDAAAALAQREGDVTKFQGDLAAWKTGAETNFNKAIAERERAELVAQTALGRLRTVAASHGLDEAELLKDVETVVPVIKKDEHIVDTSQFVNKADLQKGVIESVIGDASLYDIAAEYEMLSGKKLLNARELVIDAVKAGRQLRDYVEEKLDFKGLRTKQNEDAINLRVNTEVAAKVTAALSEAGIPGHLAPGRQDLKGSPVLRPGGIPAPPAVPGGGVNGAVAAFQAGKYSGR